MCPWEDIAKAVIGGDPAEAIELLEQHECVLTAVKGIVRGRQIIPEEIANEVQLQLLTRWDNIRGALIRASTGKPIAAQVPLFRTRINWLIQSALKDHKSLGRSTSITNDEGGEGTIDLPARPDTTVEVHATADKFWECISKLENIRSRVLLKLLGIIEGTTHDQAKLNETEGQWRPDPALHPNSRAAGEVAVALKLQLLKDRNLAAPNDWLGREFQLETKKPQDLMAQWVSRARREFADTFAGYQDDLLN